MDRIPRENYTVEDFITDESFSNYVFRLNKADERSWMDWIDRHPEKNELVQKAGEIIQALSISLSESEYQRELSRITDTITAIPSTPVIPIQDWHRRSTRAKTKRWAVLLVPVILILIAVYFLFPVSKNDSYQTTASGGNPLSITLGDNTLVTLAPNSVLRYPLAFKNKERNVYLEGEAAFIVKKKETLPFKVYAENMVVTVLGTTFHIKKPGDSAMVVDLLEGKLQVDIYENDLTQSMQLIPGQSAIYVRNDHRLYKKDAVPAFISFHQNSFEEIAGKLKQAFGITLINQSNTTNWRFTGEFHHATAKEIIESICLVKKLSYGIIGDTILIK